MMRSCALYFGMLLALAAFAYYQAFGAEVAVTEEGRITLMDEPPFRSMFEPLSPPKNDPPIIICARSNGDVVDCSRDQHSEGLGE